MRRRIAAAIAGVAILAIVLYAGPRTLVVVDLVRDQEHGETDRSADLLAQALDRRVREGRPTEAEVFSTSLREGERLVIDREGRTDVAGDTEGEPAYRARRALATGGTLTVELGDAVVDERVSEALDSIVIAATVVAIVSVVAALLLARRVVRPFDAVSTYAGALRADVGGDASPPEPPPPTGIAEADALADALTQTGARVRELVAREREFSANASHQLRTPLAALRLRLEDVTLWPDVDDDVRAELHAAIGEVDRLSATATDLLELARRGGIGALDDVVVADIVADVVERWRPAFAEAGRTIELRPPGPGAAAVPTSERSVRQILDVLLENALVHGRGATDLIIDRAPAHVAICVADQGRMSDDISHRPFERTARTPSSAGSGIGLSLAQTIAEATGARLSLVSRDPTSFELRIPRRLPDREPPAPG